MRHEGLHRTHLDILRYVYMGERTVSVIGAYVGKSISWASECIRHLEGMDLVVKHKDGLQVFVRPASNELSHSLRSLILEAPLINLSVMLDKAGLKLLPVLVDQGTTAREMALRTGLSLPTIRNKIRLWRGMGVVVRDSGSKRYRIPNSHGELRSFVVHYSRWHNRRMLEYVLPDGLIVWQWRDEFLFSVDQKIDLPDLSSAGPTRLEELGYDILHIREYYFRHPLIDVVSEEEALVQSLRTDPNNPRMMRFIVEGIESGGVAPGSILECARKYGLETALEKVVSVNG